MSSSSAARQGVHDVGQKLGERSKVVGPERRHCALDRSSARKRGALVRLRCASQQSIAAESQSEQRSRNRAKRMHVSSPRIQTGLRPFNINGNKQCRLVHHRRASRLSVSPSLCGSLLCCGARIPRTIHLLCPSHLGFALACSHYSTPCLLRGPRHAVLLVDTRLLLELSIAAAH